MLIHMHSNHLEWNGKLKLKMEDAQMEHLLEIHM